MHLLKNLAAGCLALVAVAAQAETVSGLYQVREPLAGQGAEARTQATGKALDTLILRLTGDPKAAQNPALAELRKDPQQIINQVGTEAGPPESVLVEFDPGSTERALRKAGLALWGSNRPSIIGWWLNDSVEGSNLVGDGQATAQPLRRAAQHRGLPLRLPLADLQEQLVANAKQIEASDPAPLREASERYAADALLAVHAHEADGKWQGRWQLWVGDQREQGNAEGADQAALADAVMLAVSSRLAPRYVTRPGASSQLQLQVQGMNLQRYAELSRVLEPYGARLKMAEGSTLTYGVTANREQLRAQLGLAKLQEVPAEQVPAAPVVPAPAPGAAAEQPAVPKPFDGLRFRW
ncbi:hypothetical protein D3C76_598460 [compost metagenome]|jgi:Uncharacterized protein conserved in bacteria|uniref:DUF2066 domain-containing protein n=1 Tax=Pseudomonas TaxID=286 RepID=UPI0004D9DAE3|nr:MULTISPECIES: DUF2066 domain-containing protein [Pseudomonas]KEY86976.1 hypothetical protein PC358_15120 [Pseudomonas capeferrum]MCH7299760.1 DUF2066 domain-containing protein [Pseudomonas capeferrum]MDD2062520.1 DUF2066 domain-containing protein [Pseudomonas sp. 25571]MDD2129241.1 DUF2066 domain-containing protein [Pseudomonas sp. 17391]UDU82501.1 DUF2066 domain-containing protein [Pseudomonas sp. HN2-3]